MIAPVLGTLQQLLGQLPADKYYVSREAALQAYGAEGLFNVIDFETGWKVDFVLRKSRPFSLAEFERRTKQILFGSEVFLATAEDVLLAKLEWAKLSESERQLEDAAGIARRQTLDVSYIQRWVRELGVAEQWQRVQALSAQ